MGVGERVRVREEEERQRNGRRDKITCQEGGDSVVRKDKETYP